MRTQTLKESTGRRQPVSGDRQPAAVAKERGHSQPVSPCDDLQARIAQRAYEIHSERGYRHGYALEDWVEAEREILGQECSA
jgi:hypothetical protein